MNSRAMNSRESRAGERGAVQIKTVVIIFFFLGMAFMMLKLVPVYVEQRKVIFDVEELARIAAVRNLKEDKITSELGKICSTYELPEGSIKFSRRDGQSVLIDIKYTRSVDLFVTTYDWKVEKPVVGKEL